MGPCRALAFGRGKESPSAWQCVVLQAVFAAGRSLGPVGLCLGAGRNWRCPHGRVSDLARGRRAMINWLVEVSLRNRFLSDTSTNQLIIALRPRARSDTLP